MKRKIFSCNDEVGSPSRKSLKLAGSVVLLLIAFNSIGRVLCSHVLFEVSSACWQKKDYITRRITKRLKRLKRVSDKSGPKLHYVMRTRSTAHGASTDMTRD